MRDSRGGGNGVGGDSVESHLGSSIAQKGVYPLCDFDRDSAFAHVVYKPFMMDIIEGSCDIHKDCGEDFSFLSALIDAF